MADKDISRLKQVRSDNKISSVVSYSKNVTILFNI